MCYFSCYLRFRKKWTLLIGGALNIQSKYSSLGHELSKFSRGSSATDICADYPDGLWICAEATLEDGILPKMLLLKNFLSDSSGRLIFCMQALFFMPQTMAHSVSHPGVGFIWESVLSFFGYLKVERSEQWIGVFGGTLSSRRLVCEAGTPGPS